MELGVAAAPRSLAGGAATQEPPKLSAAAGAASCLQAEQPGAVWVAHV